MKKTRKYINTIPSALCACLAVAVVAATSPASLSAQSVLSMPEGASHNATLAAEECEDDAVTISGGFGEAKFSIDVADSAAERAQGLMFREQMDAFAGMLFVYEKPQSVSFWMKNTFIPLDMIFADRNGAIASIYENAIPHDLRPIFGGDNIFAVLEVNAGVSARLGLKTGDILQHPAFGQFAARPCSIKNDD